MSHVDFEVLSAWDGGALAPDESARIEITIDRSTNQLVLAVDAAYFDDPRPESEPGSLDGLWEYEVVELFLVGDAERYVEIELGPHGHHLGLCLTGRRRVTERGFPIDFEARRDGSRWHGEALLSMDCIPNPIRAANFYAIHGEGTSRRYLAATAVPGPKPDFHRLEFFRDLTLD